MSAPFWPLSMELLRWGNRDPWTLEQACLGALITGGIGSGKTSGPFQYIVRAMMRAGFGGIFLCAKKDAAAEYKQMAAAEGRSADVVHFKHGQGSFNFLTYEATCAGLERAVVQNVVTVLMQAAEVSGRKSGGGGGKDEYFQNAMKQLLSNAIEVVLLATGQIDLRNLRDFILGLPRTIEQVETDSDSYSMTLLAGALESAEAVGRVADAELAESYFKIEFPELAPETRTSISSTLSVLLDSFLRNPLRDLLLQPSTCTPDDVLSGKIVIVDVPIKEYFEVGKIAGVIWKFCLQRAIERRLDGSVRADQLRPVFIAADESQFWVTSNDALFQTTARSSRGLTVYATQNLPNFYAELGGDATGKERVQSLLGNLQIRIACQNQEDVTNKWYSEALGKVWIDKVSKQEGSSYSLGDLNRAASTNFNQSETVTKELVEDVRTRAFLGLKTGGPSNGNVVEAILTRPGQKFSSGKRWMKVQFKQNISTPGALERLFGGSTIITAPRIAGYGS